jgi:hypothetical protein
MLEGGGEQTVNKQHEHAQGSGNVDCVIERNCHLDPTEEKMNVLTKGLSAGHIAHWAKD